LVYLNTRAFFYSGLICVSFSSFEIDTTWLAKWYEIGLNNHWIPLAYDPPFTMDSFSECKTLENLLTKLQGGCWALGTAFYYKNLCFIQQVGGGDEWLIIKEDKSFESYSSGAVLNRDTFKFVKDIYRYLNTPTSEIRNSEYEVAIPEEIEIDGIIYRDEVKIADEKLKHYFDIFHEQDHDYHRDMLRRNESMKGKHREFVNYLKYKGYQINDTTLSKDYDKSEVKWIDETTLDKSKFAWNVKSNTVNKFDVTSIMI